MYHSAVLKVFIFLRPCFCLLCIPAASASGNILRDVRKKLGYFTASDIDLTFRPDLEPPKPLPGVGISCVGAVPLIINLNMKLAPRSPRKEVIKITQSIRVPQLVESLTLSHEGGALEIACNLRNTCKYSVSEVMENAYKKAKELGESSNML